MPEKTKTALSKDGTDPLLLGHLAYGGRVLLLQGSRRTVLSGPYNKVGGMTLLRMLTLVLV